MIKNIHWVHIIFFGATLNVIVNFGYKVLAADIPLGLIGAMGFGFAAMTLAIYGVFKRDHFRSLLVGKALFYLFMMGCAAAVSAICFFIALARGPISLIDPLWACVYSLISLLIGMILVKERPNRTAIAGIILYLSGVVLMSQG